MQSLVLADSGVLEPGDRFELHVVATDDRAVRIELPRTLLSPLLRPRRIEDESQKLLATLDDEATSFAIKGPLRTRLLDPGVESIWLEFLSTGRYRLSVNRAAAKSGSSGDATNGSEWPQDPGDLQLLARPANCSDPAEFRLGLQAARLATQPGFDQMISIPTLREMEVLEHQTRTYYARLREEAAAGALRGADPAAAEARAQSRRESVDREEQLRIAELRRKSELRVELKLTNLIVVYQPKLKLSVSVAAKARSAGSMELIWDPATESVEPANCPACGQPSFKFDIDRRGLKCTACPPRHG